MLRPEARPVNAEIRPPHVAAADRVLLGPRCRARVGVRKRKTVPLDSHMSQRATVLVVDDDADVTDTMREILEDEGHRVLVADNGIRALEITREERPDLVLLDLEMPEMDGRHFLSEVRATPELARVQVVVVSGSSDARSLGAETVTKPLRLDTLLGLIDRVAHAAE